MTIDSAIADADLEQLHDVWGGDCLSIAIALSDHFNGEVIFVTATPGAGFDHALMELNGVLYDGAGQVGWGETVSRFVPRNEQSTVIDDHFYFPDDPRSEGYDTNIYQSVLAALKN